MADPVSLIVHRPHETLDTLVETDAWVVGRTDILLVGQPALPPKTLVRFEVTLAGGDPVISGDGWAVSNEPDDGAGTGGVRVRFRTVDKSSKAVLRRMLELQKKGLAERPKPPIEAAPVEAAAPVETAPVEAVAEAPDATEELRSGPRLVAPAAPATRGSGPRRSVRAVAPPDDRDALLDRLRTRARELAKVHIEASGPDKAAS
jgi:hypothetical protein